MGGAVRAARWPRLSWDWPRDPRAKTYAPAFKTGSGLSDPETSGKLARPARTALAGAHTTCRTPTFRKHLSYHTLNKQKSCVSWAPQGGQHKV